MDVCNSKSVLLVALFVLVLGTARCSVDQNSCESIFHRESFDPNDGWGKSGCRLHKYLAGDVVKCLNAMQSAESDSSRPKFVFFGDSRTRQIGYNFLKASTIFDCGRIT